MNEIAISVGVPVWFVRWNPHGNEPIETIRHVCDSILDMTAEIEWEHGQFNVSYIGYNDNDLERNEKRKNL